MRHAGTSWLNLAGLLRIAAERLYSGSLVGGAQSCGALPAGAVVSHAANYGDARPTIMVHVTGLAGLGLSAFAFPSAPVTALRLEWIALVAICAVLVLRRLGVPLRDAWGPDLLTTCFYTAATLCAVSELTFLGPRWETRPALTLKGPF